ncbi:MAG: alpha/beta hydrolase [Motiliproteus sp.]|nr:alpha/beta hydrolase [Motiliproteus sp.]MCW9051157.1 alpha/beta hydrolase [Motiliproteus sp.]
MANLTTSDGTNIEYLIHGESGNAATVIFLHGWCSNGFEWLPYARELPSAFRSLCWNARGHGLIKVSDDCDMSLSRMADDLQELILKEAPEGAIILGHSMGALTLWRYIERYGCNRLQGLCILDQTPKLVTDDDWSLGVYGNFDQERNERFCQHLTDDFTETVVGLIYATFDGGSGTIPDNSYVKRLREYLSSLRGEKLLQCWQSLTEADLRGALAKIQVPTMLIYGDRSQFYSPEVARWVHTHIDASQLIRYSEADHSPHAGAKTRFVADFNGFLESLSLEVRSPQQR